MREENTPEMEMREVIGCLEVANEALIDAFMRLEKLVDTGELYEHHIKIAQRQENTIIKIGTNVTNSIATLGTLCDKIK